MSPFFGVANGRVRSAQPRAVFQLNVAGYRVALQLCDGLQRCYVLLASAATLNVAAGWLRINRRRLAARRGLDTHRSGCAERTIEEEEIMARPLRPPFLDIAAPAAPPELADSEERIRCQHSGVAEPNSEEYFLTLVRPGHRGRTFPVAAHAAPH